MIMYTNTSMVHMGIITHHSPLYEGNDQVAMAIQTFIIPLHSFNTSNYTGKQCNVHMIVCMCVCVYVCWRDAIRRGCKRSLSTGM